MTNEPRSPRRAIPGWLRGLALIALIALLVYAARQQQQEPAKKPAPHESPPTAADAPRDPKVPQQRPAPRTSESPRERETPRTAEPPRKTERPAADRPRQPESEEPDTTQTVIDSQTIRDLDGEIVHRGQVDVSETLARIDAGEQLRFPNDGVTFQNRERRLPQQRSGYYCEWVHPTPGLRGPGPQRIVTGQRGEIYYTPDHYRTFRRLDGG